MTSSLRERFNDKYTIEQSGCWRWTARIDRYGYGQIRVGSQTDGSRRTLTAHRVSWGLHKGPIPEGTRCSA